MSKTLFDASISLSVQSIDAALSINMFIIVAIMFAAIPIVAYRLSTKRRSANIVFLKKVSLKIAGQSVEYEIIRNDQTLEVAHKIYIELITRKAAIPIDEESDIITEIYDSWYQLFEITREEIKAINGKSLISLETESLITLVTEVLNKGLRPHLTKFQGAYRRWYEYHSNRDEFKNLSPQEIQRKYPLYDELICSMVTVNNLLSDYAKQLRIFIYSNS